MTIQQDYYTLVTDIGLAKESNAHVEGQPNVQLCQMAIGDSDGTSYNPSSDMTTLKHEVYRTELSTVYTDPKHPNQLIVKAVIPPEVGGFTLREVGIIDSDGDLFAIGNYPETLKPVLANGASKDLIITLVLGFSNTPDVALIVDPNITHIRLDEFRKATKAIYARIDEHKDNLHSHNGGFQAILETQSVGPVGLHNRYFDIEVTDYGTICGEQPFASENVPTHCSDLARGDAQIDYGNLETLEAIVD